ncbi:MAG: hypothetical protein ACE5KM_17470 [Planctomycetaceae bacterium]
MSVRRYAVCTLFFAALAAISGDKASSETVQTTRKVNAESTCTVKWSKLYWDKSRRQHYITFTNGCSFSVYCKVTVTRGTQKNYYGRCVGGKSSYRMYIGVLKRDDKAEAGINSKRKC